jgi:hypothetical protein
MEEAEEMGEKHVTGLKLTPHQLFFLFYKLRIIEPRAKKKKIPQCSTVRTG